MATPVYVTGHINPDTDSIAAALGYAWLLRERDGIDAVASRAGTVNPQTSWVLRHLGVEIPILLTDASPRFESVVHRYDTTYPDYPLRDAWAIASRTGGVTPLVNHNGTPFGLITGETLFSFLIKMVGPHPRNQEIRLRELLELPCRDAANLNVPKFQASTRIRDVLQRLLREDKDEFFVVDESGNYVGICRQRDLLNPPRIKIILVDHNETQQAVSSLEEAELLEVLDHHRLGNPSTHVPIKFTVDIVGSTSTLVSERIEQAGLSAPPKIAGVLLAGLLSDTLVLTSPTTTDRDRLAADRLGRWAFIGGTIIGNETVATYGKKVLAASAGLSAREPKDIVSGDLKIYNSGGHQFAIAQAEVSDLYEVSDRLVELESALESLRSSKGLDFAMLMVTDIVQGSSRLITTSPFPSALDDLPYPPQQDGTRMAVGVVSRKKQLLPGILSLLEV